MNLRSLNKRLEYIERKIGPPSAEEIAFPATRATFLAALADDPLFAMVIEPEFRLAQIRLFVERGVGLDDMTVDDRIWLLTNESGRRLGDVLDQSESYLDFVWKNAERTRI